MAGPRADKVAVVDEVREHLGSADAAILTEYRGLKVADMASLRRQLRAAGAEYKIYKNTLVRRATAGTVHEALHEMLEGPTAIAFVDTDVAAVAKVLREFARTNPALVVKGSFVGSGVLDARTTNALADLPSREALLAQIAGALAAPLRQMAGLLKALPQNLAYGISALVDQRVAAGESPPPSAADTAAPDTAEPDTAEPDTAEPVTGEAATSGEEAPSGEAEQPAESAAPEAGAAPEEAAAPGEGDEAAETPD